MKALGVALVLFGLLAMSQACDFSMKFFSDGNCETDASSEYPCEGYSFEDGVCTPGTQQGQYIKVDCEAENVGYYTTEDCSGASVNLNSDMCTEMLGEGVYYALVFGEKCGGSPASTVTPFWM
ncbi:hypothetical protein QOT17_005540 [Balamuthia mandrillaris]